MLEIFFVLKLEDLLDLNMLVLSKIAILMSLNLTLLSSQSFLLFFLFVLTIKVVATLILLRVKPILHLFCRHLIFFHKLIYIIRFQNRYKL